jgi:hypothetical protein
VDSEKPASVVPARLSALPKVTMPVTVKVCGDVPSRTRTRSPTLKWSFVAVPLSMTTSAAAVGARPSTRRTDDSWRSGSKEKPSAEPASPTALPPDTNCA